MSPRPTHPPDRAWRSVYVGTRMATELAEEATRQDRDVSSLVAQSWALARERVRAIPAGETSSPPSTPHLKGGR